MADRIKGITIEIGGDTTGLRKALSGVNSDIRSTQSQLKDVERLLKLDPSNTELLAQKQKLLSDAVKETKDKLETLKEAEKQAQNQFAQGKISEEQYNGLKREIIATEEQLESLEKQAQSANTTLQQIGEVGEKFKDVGGKITVVGQKLLPVSAAVAGVGVAAVKTTADFDEAMSKVAAISGATGEKFDALREKAREMGEKTKFSASEAAAAFTYMAMAGWDAEQMMAGIDGIMNLSAADGLDLATTSDIVTDALTAFGLQASDSAHFADVLAKASSSANTNVSMLGESFKYVAPVAGTLGYSAEDTAIALGLMANAGIKASQAGTSLKTALANMASPTKNMLGVMNEFNLSLQNSDGSMKDFKEVMDMLRKNMAMTTEEQRQANYAMEEQAVIASGNGKILEGLSDEQKKLTLQWSKGVDIVESLTKEQLKSEASTRLGIKLTKERTLNEKEYYELAKSLGKDALQGIDEAQQAAAASTLFGKEAMAGMLNIINASEEDYNKLANAIYNADGTAKKMADTMQDNLNGQLTILKSQLQEAAISIGDALIPMIRGLTAKIQELVNWFNGLSESQKQMVATAGLVVAGLAPLLIIVGQLAASIGSILTMVSTMGPLLTAIGGPGGLLLVAAAALSALGASLIFVKDNTADYYEEAARLTDQERQNKEKVDELLESYQSLSASRAEAVSSIESQSQHENELWQELQNIVDENGRVKEGYEARAAFITTTLSEALGTEISITDGVIQNYRDLQAEIDGLILKKQQEATLSAYEEEYNNALANRKSLQGDVLALTGQSKEAAEKYSEALAEEKVLQAEYNERMKEFVKTAEAAGGASLTESRELAGLQQELANAKAATQGYKERMDEVNTSLATSQTLLETFNATVANYEGASAAILMGDQQAISASLLLLQNDFKTAETATRESLEAQCQTYRTKLAEAKMAVAEGAPGITAEYLTELAQLLQKSEAELAKLPAGASTATTNTAEAVKAGSAEMEIAGSTVGSSYTSGMAEGIADGTGDVTAAATEVATAGITAARDTLDSHSPSRVTHDIGIDFDAGFAGGISEGAGLVADAVDQVMVASVSALSMQLQQSSATTQAYQNTIKVNWITWAAELTSLMTQALTGINATTNSEMQSMQNRIKVALESMKNDWKQKWSDIKNAHKTELTETSQYHEETLTKMTQATVEKTGEMKDKSVTAMQEMTSGMQTELSKVENVVRGGFDPAVAHIESLIPQFHTWGNHMMQELIDGLRDYLAELEAVCEDIADTISDNLHFTRPERGSLRNYEEWMPHFMQGLAKGIEDNKYLVTEQIKQLVDDMAALSGAGQQTRQPVNLTNHTVLAMDGRVLAETVDEQLGILL